MLKKALAYDGLARGLHEAARAIERDEAKVGPLLMPRKPIFPDVLSGHALRRHTCSSDMAVLVQQRPVNTAARVMRICSRPSIARRASMSGMSDQMSDFAS